MSIVTIVIGVILAWGAAQELVVRGIRGGLFQPAVLGAVGVLTSGLLIWAGFAAWRHAPHARQLTIAAALLTIAVHAYGVLPPHHNIGVFAAALAIGYGVALLLVRGTTRPADVS